MAGHGWERGAAAIVGVADMVSPTGELDGTPRAIETAVIAEALDAAGLTLADVDGVASCIGGSVHAVGRAGRVPGRPGPLDRHHPDRRLELRGPCRARSRCHPARTGRGGGGVIRQPSPVDGQAGRSGVLRFGRSGRRRRCRGGGTPARVGDALRHAVAGRRLRAGRQPSPGRLRHHVRAAGPDRGGHPALGRLEPQGQVPGSAVGRRRPVLAHGGLAPPPLRLLPGHRRCRRSGADQRRAGPRPAGSAGLRPRRRHRPQPPDDLADARPDRHRRVGLGTEGLRAGRRLVRATWTWPSCTTRSPSPCCWPWRTWAFAPRARVVPSWPTAGSGRAAPFRPRPPAVACPTPIPACSGCSCWWRRLARSNGRRAPARYPTSTWPWPTAWAASFRLRRPSSSERRQPCDPAHPARVGRGRPLLGGHPLPAAGPPVVHLLRPSLLVSPGRVSGLPRHRHRVAGGDRAGHGLCRQRPAQCRPSRVQGPGPLRGGPGGAGRGRPVHEQHRQQRSDRRGGGPAGPPVLGADRRWPRPRGLRTRRGEAAVAQICEGRVAVVTGAGRGHRPGPCPRAGPPGRRASS